MGRKHSLINDFVQISSNIARDCIIMHVLSYAIINVSLLISKDHTYNTNNINMYSYKSQILAGTILFLKTNLISFLKLKLIRWG
jgi:hypothetical protein